MKASSSRGSSSSCGTSGLLISVLAVGCAAVGPPPPPATDSGDGLAATDRAAYEATIAHLEQQNRELDERLRGRHDPPAEDGLGGESRADLHNQLAQCEVREQQYKAGLERAVAALNSQQRDALADAQRVAAMAPAPRKANGRISSRWGPRLQIVGTDFLITGELWSYRDVAADVRLHLELLEDGLPVAETWLSLHVPANTDQTYTHTFHYTPRDSVQYSARAEVVE